MRIHGKAKKVSISGRMIEIDDPSLYAENKLWPGSRSEIRVEIDGPVVHVEVSYLERSTECYTYVNCPVDIEWLGKPVCDGLDSTEPSFAEKVHEIRQDSTSTLPAGVDSDAGGPAGFVPAS